MSRDTSSFDRALFERLGRSDTFATYRDAFRTATGLPLLLVGTTPEEWCIGGGTPHRSPFCERLGACLTSCGGCIESNRRLLETAAAGGPTSRPCFAGMSASAVPVRAGARLVGFLKTGQVFTRTPAEESFAALAAKLRDHGVRAEDVASLREAYFQTQRIEPERYTSMITLLTAFAEQLGKLAEKLPVEDAGGSDAVARAKRHVEAELTKPLPLAEVARAAGLSPSQFCRVFKEETGITLVDYINRRRIEAAKRLLIKPGMRVSEVGFAVGYQSVSQFNRCFVQLTGRTPTRYREEELAALAA